MSPAQVWFCRQSAQKDASPPSHTAFWLQRQSAQSMRDSRVVQMLSTLHGRQSSSVDELAIVPSIEGALPQCLIIPSVALAAGVPMRLRFDDGVHVGARMQLSASLAMFGVVVPVDFYPGTKDPWRVAALAQVWF